MGCNYINKFRGSLRLFILFYSFWIENNKQAWKSFSNYHQAKNHTKKSVKNSVKKSFKKYVKKFFKKNLSKNLPKNLSKSVKKSFKNLLKFHRLPQKGNLPQVKKHCPRILSWDRHLVRDQAQLWFTAILKSGHK